MESAACLPRSGFVQQPREPYKELGRVSVDKYSALGMSRSGDEIHRLMKEKAASIGGDAIINVTEDFASVSGVVIVFTQK